ncbi:MAG: 50S ribosomal protein L3 N(5)-glutamine methyltransferase [Ottowia sp.]|nr:MAG: 50S ribosomal protein L3 N(5)-glutamine methyltransferase [Ottowia sp.]
MTTLTQLITDTERQLSAAGVAFGHGTTNARDEAAWLVLHALGLPLDTDLSGSEGNQPVSPAGQAQAAMLLKARIDTRQPLAYLTGQAWLQGVPFHVDARAIVPRSLIAELIADGGIDPWLSERTRRVLDLCTGNGSLAVLAALAWPEVQVDAADLSRDALAVARLNVERHGLQQRIRLIESDGLAACPGPYDLIVCNPPYVNAASMAALPPEFRAEPALALAGGADGMDFIRPLLRQAPTHLNAGGLLMLEIGHARAHFDAAFPQLQPVWLDTSAGDAQVLLLTREALAP